MLVSISQETFKRALELKTLEGNEDISNTDFIESLLIAGIEDAELGLELINRDSKD